MNNRGKRSISFWLILLAIFATTFCLLSVLSGGIDINAPEAAAGMRFRYDDTAGFWANVLGALGVTAISVLLSLLWRLFVGDKKDPPSYP